MKIAFGLSDKMKVLIALLFVGASFAFVARPEGKFFMSVIAGRPVLTDWFARKN